MLILFENDEIWKFEGMLLINDKDNKIKMINLFLYDL
jgi:hypothetical protein